MVEQRCSFCQKGRREVRALIAPTAPTAPSGIICDECVGLCMRILARQLGPQVPRRFAGLLQIAQDVRATACGTYHRPMEAQTLDVSILREAAANWRPPHLAADAYWDGAVLGVVKMALAAVEVTRGPA